MEENKNIKINIVGGDKLANEEKETHIYLNYVDNVWIADTSIQRDITKFHKQGWKEKIINNYEDGTICSIVFEAPRNAISIGKAEKGKREMSEEQRQAARERLMLARNKK